ncbi:MULTISPECIES: sulfite exporter TauE/SafE family protein [Rhodomicrobium]|uniref:sulfite exporter TauE/SafE family protein n=1 Tax=Rhodomicrobium TaxID=1068 RepID=UPI001AEC86B1|nr:MULTISPECIES: sulfite exporter TauE/SafE family protein [Rhodomicrobium]
MLISASLTAALAVILLFTSFLSGIFGMAGGMILMGVLLPILPVPTAMVLHAVSQATSNGWRAVLWGRYIEWRIFARYAAGLAAALAVFAFVRWVPDPALVLIILGLMPFAAIMIPDRLAPRADRAGGAEFAGFAGTVLQLVSGVSGPILDIFFVRTMMDRRAVVATKAACQTVTHFTKLIYFGGLAGNVGEDLGWGILCIAVVMAVIGTSASRLVLERMTDVQFRRWTRGLVMAIGAVYLAQGITTYIHG